MIKILGRLTAVCCIMLCAFAANAVVIPDGLYYIFSQVDSNYVIDDNGSAVYNGNNIHLWKLNKSKAQQWKVENRNGAVIFRSAVNTNYVIDNNGSIVGNGNNIHLWEYNGSAAQLWYPEKLYSNRDVYVLRSACNRQYVIDLNGSGTYDGNNIQLYQYNGTKAQQWFIIGVGELEFDDFIFDLLFGN